MRLEIVITVPDESGNEKEKRFTDLLLAQYCYGSYILTGKTPPKIRVVIIED